MTENRSFVAGEPRGDIVEIILLAKMYLIYKMCLVHQYLKKNHGKTVLAQRVERIFAHCNSVQFTFIKQNISYLF